MWKPNKDKIIPRIFLICPRCGEIYTGWKRPGNSWDSDYVSHTHTIGYAYGIGCGKSTSTIESAVINM